MRHEKPHTCLVWGFLLVTFVTCSLITPDNVQTLYLMTRPSLAIETEFELMADYQTAIESKSVIVENALEDPFRYSLYAISEPFPTYEEYMNGNDFDEEELLAESNTRDELQIVQNERK